MFGKATSLSLLFLQLNWHCDGSLFQPFKRLGNYRMKTTPTYICDLNLMWKNYLLDTLSPYKDKEAKHAVEKCCGCQKFGPMQ